MAKRKDLKIGDHVRFLLMSNKDVAMTGTISRFHEEDPSRVDIFIDGHPLNSVDTADVNDVTVLDPAADEAAAKATAKAAADEAAEKAAADEAAKKAAADAITQAVNEAKQAAADAKASADAAAQSAVDAKASADLAAAKPAPETPEGDAAEMRAIGIDATATSEGIEVKIP